MSTSESRYAVGAARHDDLPAIRRLLAAADLPVEGVGALIAEFVVARAVDEQGGALLAAGAVEPCAEAGLLRSVVVHPEARGLGLGRRVTETLIDRAAARGLDALYLLTETAESFFSRIGFEPTGRESAPESVRRTDEFRVLCPDSAVLMRLDLSGRTSPTS